MKRLALNVCSDLAGLIHDGDSSLWPVVDRIEKRFRIQGATESKYERLKAQRREFLAAQAKRHNAANPDRLTYLFR